MRLKEYQIKLLCQKVLVTLRSQKLITLKKTDNEILHAMEEIVKKDLREEQDIQTEAERILAQNIAKMGSNIDREQMLQLIKKQLMKDKHKT